MHYRAAWPNNRRFKRLKNLAATQEIRVLAYPFERRWLLGHQAQERIFTRSNRLEAGARAGILGIDSELLPTTMSGRPDSPTENAQRDPPMLAFERNLSRRRSPRPLTAASGTEARRARLVEFHGGCYTLLTEWAHLYVLNELMDKGLGDGGSLRTVFGSELSGLSRDDFVLFRAGGGKEFIRMLAEVELGNEEYERVRTTAETWKSPLRRLGSTPDRVQSRFGRVWSVSNTADDCGLAGES